MGEEQNTDIDSKLFNYLRRNLKFRAQYIPEIEKPFITYVFDGEMRLVTSKKDVLNKVFNSLDDKWTQDQTKARKTIRKFINDSLEDLR